MSRPPAAAPTGALVPVTPLLLRYDRYRKTGDHRYRLAEAQHFVKYPGELAAEFAASVSHFAPFDQGGAAFFPVRKESEATRPGDRLVRHLMEAGPIVPVDAPDRLDSPAGQTHLAHVRAEDLAFKCVAREVLIQQAAPTPRWEDGESRRGTVADALIVSGSEPRLPGVAEVKIGNDKDLYYALVQALACAAHLATANQSERLRRVFGDACFAPRRSDPRLDIYILLGGTSTFSPGEEFTELATTLAAALLRFEAVSRHIRRIASLHLAEASQGTYDAAVRFGWERKSGLASA